MIPIDSRNMPSAVRRTSRVRTTNTASAITTGVGMPSRWPEPMDLNGGLVTVVICPWVMSIAIPRPATMRMRVAMKG